MTTKVRLIKLLEEVRDAGRPPLRRFPLKPAMLYLMELRSHSAEACVPGKRLTITTDLQDSMNLPHPVKITHLAPSKTTPALAPA